MQKNGALSNTLLRLRGTARMSQRDLAETTKLLGDKVSEATIRAIENETTIPKPLTLKRLSNALAHDAFTGGVNSERAESIYQELIQATGYGGQSLEAQQSLVLPTPDPLAVHIEAAFGDRAELIEDFLEQAKDFPEDDRRWILETAGWMLRRLQTLRDVAQDEDWHPRQPPPPPRREHSLAASS